MSKFKRSQQKYVKKPYRVRNWADYEACLRSRGDLTVWIAEDELTAWEAPQRGRRKPGRQRKYSDQAIETALTVGMVFHLRLRQTEGFLRSLFLLLGLTVDVPDHSTISRRSKRLGKLQIVDAKETKPIHILVDSSGLRVHVGQLRKPPKKRDWRKIHLAIDERTGD